jgi:hypothetical protein
MRQWSTARRFVSQVELMTQGYGLLWSGENACLSS